MKSAVFAVLCAIAASLTTSEIQEAAFSQEVIDYMTTIRRHLHQYPELGFQENKTSAYIQSQLDALGIKYTTGWGVNSHSPAEGLMGGTGVVADIGTGESPCIALRADIDALAILEATTDLDFKSTINGKMHACGHDGHTAILLGAAKILKANESKINGTIRLMFQPAEEGGAGASMMVNEGVFKVKPEVDRVFGLHQMPHLPTNVVASKAGGIMAGSDFFWGSFTCKGGHGAMPHVTIDPVQALSAFISQAQTIVARNISPLDSGVLSITKVGASDQFNVIASQATFGGTFRSYTEDGMKLIKRRLIEIGEGIAQGFGCEKFEIETLKVPYIPTINNPQVWAEVKQDLGFINQLDSVDPAHRSAELLEAEPIMPGEDFSFFLREKPGVFFFLGSGSKPDHNWPLHSNKFRLDEDVLPQGALLLSSAAVTQIDRINKAKEAENKCTVRI